MTIADQLQAQPEPTSRKQAWDAPRVTQLQAGSAEFEQAGNDDGVDLS
jgi:hypothetical protein